MKSDSSGNDKDLVRVGLPDDLGLADTEDLVIGVDHGCGRSAHAEETNLRKCFRAKKLLKLQLTRINGENMNIRF